MLFKTKDKLIEYAELSGAINFASVKSTIRVVETQHVIPVLGQELYTLINAAYTAVADETTLSQIQKDLLDKCRCVIGPMLCYYYAPKSEVKLSDQGAQRLETATNKTAYQNQVTNFREQNLREAEVATELLLQFLEEKKADYPQWITSEAFTDYRSLFIRSGKEFNKLFSSHSPYRNYWAMRSKMLDVEQSSIRTLLGDELFDYLKTKDTDNALTLSTIEADLLFKVKKVIAYLTVAFSIPFLNVRMDELGITVMGNNRAQNDNINSRMASNDKALNVIIEKSEAAAKSWINNVENFLNADANVGLFTGWPIVTVASTTGVIDNRGNWDCFNEERSGSFGLV